MSRWLAPLMAFCVSFIIIAGLAPILGLTAERQLDFWLLWFVSMLLLALPIAYLEIALAKRSKTTALNALSTLTRDADVSAKWRGMGWLACLFIPFLAGGLLNNISQISLQYSQLNLDGNIALLMSLVLALALSFVPRKLLVILTALGVVASVIVANVFGTSLAPWQVTAIEFNEWGNATVLALVASGLGLGIYWQSSLQQVQQQQSASSTVLPIWIAQLLAVVAFGYFGITAQIPAVALFISTVFAAALLLQLTREQLQHRQVSIVVQYAILVLGLAIWLVPMLDLLLNPLLMLLGLLICLLYSIFVGWLMKISHLRKAMNFSNELFYNLWRIAIRIILPLAIVLAIISYLGQWF
ncbi:SNF family Na+-dependent transporter [Acinetobacter calcoaceticus]|uniref:SNF family Na+-dependent transporter n=1 Tax=Acinetobacter calcoaceticus TaxID=471 RepID=A0A4R1XYS9_ACICA|nr:SNF family Na+-dependent transporter [Acinetobacter calcoaceticus]